MIGGDFRVHVLREFHERAHCFPGKLDDLPLSHQRTYSVLVFLIELRRVEKRRIDNEGGLGGVLDSRELSID
jgi:hypothetical protein